MMFHAAKSIALYLYDKQLNLKLQMFVELGAQLLGVLLMITWAYYAPSLWALVAGNILSSLIACITSYIPCLKDTIAKFRFEGARLMRLFLLVNGFLFHLLSVLSHSAW